MAFEFIHQGQVKDVPGKAEDGVPPPGMAVPREAGLVVALRADVSDIQ